MSTLRAIVTAVADLANSLDALLQTDTAKAAPELAKELGAQVQFNQAVELLGERLQQLRAGLEKLREPLLPIGALAGLVSLLRPLQPSLRRLVDSVESDLDRLGLAQTGPAFDSVAHSMERSAQVLTLGQTLLQEAPLLTEINNLLVTLQNLSVTLAGFKVAA